MMRYPLTRAIIGLAMTFSLIVATLLPVSAQSALPYVPGEVVVKLVQPSDLAGVAAAFALDPTPLDQFGTRPIYRLRILDGVDPETRAIALTGDARVLYAEPNYIEDTPEGRQRMKWARGGSATSYAEQWAGDKIGLPAAHTVTRGAGITVAVLDTGIDATHPAFAGRLRLGYDFVNMDQNPREEGTPAAHPVYGHGTHVAGLVALAAPAAKIMPIRVLDANGQGNIWVLAEALAYAADPDQNPATNDGAQVINLSLSTPRRTALLDEIVGEITCSDDDDDDDSNGGGDDDGEDEGGEDDGGEENGNDNDDDCTVANGRGVVVIAAAGNSASPNPEYPAAEAIDGLLAVAASTQADTLAPYSNYGDWVHVSAPGDQIISPVPGNDYGVWSGTSMAAPLVAGHVALLRAVNPTWDAATVANEVISNAVSIGSLAPPRINAAMLMSATVSTTHLLYLPQIYR